ncbi:MAG TPA: class I SAM-dependent methyltransferase [Roseiarcus sp.]
MLKYDLPWIGRLYRQRNELRQRLEHIERERAHEERNKTEQEDRLQSIQDKLDHLVSITAKYSMEEHKYLEQLTKVEPLRNDDLRQNSEQSTRRVDSANAYPVFLVNRTQQDFTLLNELRRRTAVECADYAHERMPLALHFDTRERLLDYVLETLNSNDDGRGLFVEFGVYKGHSVNYFAKGIRSGRTIYGFDSFEGLHVDWIGNDLAKGAFDLGGILPEVEKNVILIKGWFDQTLPEFFAEHSEPIWFISHDADTYEAAKLVFKFTAPRLRPGTMIVFDDYWGYRGWKSGEHKAWAELIAEMNIKYDYLAFTVQQVFVIIRSIG